MRIIPAPLSHCGRWPQRQIRVSKSGSLSMRATACLSPMSRRVAAIESIEELNIGHALIGRSILIGIAGAIHELRAVMNAARQTF